MSDLFFWGEGGEYGPYHAQTDGWPNAGEVMRDYRLKAKVSTEEFAKRYSLALQARKPVKEGLLDKPVSASWIVNMEKENRIPTDIARRRLLAELLCVPPILFGLGTLDDVLLSTRMSQRDETVGIPSTTSKHPVLNITTCRKNIEILWQLNYTSHAEDSLQDVVTLIKQLESSLQYARGSLLLHIQELLYSHYLFANAITRHLGQFSTAYIYANHAVRVTKDMDNKEFISAAYYKRGFTYLRWGLLGEKTSIGIIEPKREKIVAAIQDFEVALPNARPQLKGYIWLELSRARSLLLQHARDIPLILQLTDDAEHMVGRGSVEKPHTQIMLDGELAGLSEGRHLLAKAITLVEVGRSGQAIRDMDELEELEHGKGIGKSETRTHGWMDILYALASIKEEDYYTATYRAIRAFGVFKDINSAANIAFVKDIHNALLKTSYKRRDEVKFLGNMLDGYYKGFTYHQA